MKRDKSNIKKRVITGIIALVIAFVTGAAATINFPENVENMAQDALYQTPGVIPDDIKIIAIDEETLTKLGPYSDWDREYFARLIEVLNQNPEKAPKIIGIDVVFSGSNHSKEDEKLVRACETYGNVVLASTLKFDEYLYKYSEKEYDIIQYVSNEGRPYDELAQVAEYGFTNAIYDDDGIVRKTHTRYTSLFEGETTVYDSFAYLIASKVGKVKEYDFQVEIALVSTPGEFEIISMSDVLDGTVKAEHFENCIVLIGAYTEGMMDSYRVPIDYSTQMYGVELQANYIYGFLNDRVIYPVNGYIQFFITFFVVLILGLYALNNRIRNVLAAFAFAVGGYFLSTVVVFKISSHMLNILAVPLGATLVLMTTLIYKYIEMQKKRMYEMRDMLFSMAEAMAETIEGRTPYNANHTKNVAKRCVEMLDYINLKHRQKKTKLHFSEKDKRELYLAAMLHDVGKMDVPLAVMDKETKLGNRERQLKDRLEIIGLRIENDALNGVISREEANEKQKNIRAFLENLGAFNCGKPLSEAEWTLIDKIADSVYEDRDGVKIPYMNQEEIDDLHIKTGTLSEKERTVMQSHVEYTDKILAHIQFGDQFKNVRSMASNHHELLNGKGYPKGLDEKELDTMTRILTIMDIYDSLIADDRPYKKPKSVKDAFHILDMEAQAGKIDKKLLEFARELYLKDE